MSVVIHISDFCLVNFYTSSSLHLACPMRARPALFAPGLPSSHPAYPLRTRPALICPACPHLPGLPSSAWPALICPVYVTCPIYRLLLGLHRDPTTRSAVSWVCRLLPGLLSLTWPASPAWFSTLVTAATRSSLLLVLFPLARPLPPC